jgi:signal peptidase I
MGPRVRTGDAVVWQTDVPDQLPQNAVVVYSQGERTVIHRAIGNPAADLYTTKGDANATPDPEPVHTSQIHGIGQLLVPIVGLPVVWWSNGQQLPVIVVGLALLLAIWTAHRAWDPEQDPWREEIALLHPGTRDRDALLVSSSRKTSGPMREDDRNAESLPSGALLSPDVRAALLGSERATP